MAGTVARAIVAAALLITWSLPGARLSVLPRERALALAADAICWAEPSAAPVSLRTATAVASSGTQGSARLADAAVLFEPLAARQWTSELARVALAMLAAALLLARWRFAPPLVIAAATLYLSSYPVHWDAYRLAIVTGSPRLWWLAIGQWSPALWSERLAAPVTVWLSLIGAAALWLAGALRHRRGAPVQPIKAACFVDGRRAQPTS